MDVLKTSINDTTQYIVIRLGVEHYGIDIKYVDNIVRMQKITRVPKVADYIKGVINLRGEVIPVMSLRLKMDLPEDELTSNKNHYFEVRTVRYYRYYRRRSKRSSNSC